MGGEREPLAWMIVLQTTMALSVKKGEQHASTAKIAIIGSGFGGLGTAIRLKAGIEDFIVFERADDVGGVRRDNT